VVGGKNKKPKGVLLKHEAPEPMEKREREYTKPQVELAESDGRGSDDQ
jgi:hypothetical protein